MKAKRLLFLVMAICLASGVNAQFYDGPDDIYYYVEVYTESDEMVQSLGPLGMPSLKWEKTGKKEKKYPKEGSEHVMIFNFDGTKAAELSGYLMGTEIYNVRKKLQDNSSYYEDKVETTVYNFKYSTSSSGTTYKDGSYLLIFSSDRNTLIEDHEPAWAWRRYYKRVDKSYFRVGRSRTPSGKMYE